MYAPRLILCLALSLVAAPPSMAAGKFEALDVFQLEYAADPRISPDGRQVVYVRNSNDIMSDRTIGNLWIAASDGSDHR
ncbi:MAG: S9 family peptidase, partial [Woeseiaceae bacterium]